MTNVRKLMNRLFIRHFPGPIFGARTPFQGNAFKHIQADHRLAVEVQVDSHTSSLVRAEFHYLHQVYDKSMSSLSSEPTCLNWNQTLLKLQTVILVLSYTGSLLRIEIPLYQEKIYDKNLQL